MLDRARVELQVDNSRLKDICSQVGLSEEELLSFRDLVADLEDAGIGLSDIHANQHVISFAIRKREEIHRATRLLNDLLSLTRERRKSQSDAGESQSERLGTEIAQVEYTLAPLLKTLGITNGTPESIASSLSVFNSRMPACDIIERHNGMRFTRLLRSGKEATNCADRVRRSKEEVDRCESDLTSRKEELNRISAAASPKGTKAAHKEIEEIARRVGVSIPLSLIGASDPTREHFYNQLRSAVILANSQAIKLSELRNAMFRYHERLSSPNVDLQELVIAEANVVAATCSGIAGSKQFNAEFDYVIIDEAGRATPLDLLIPMVRGKTIVLVGDHKQLGPILDSEITEELVDVSHSEQTLFQCLFEHMHESRKQALSLEYRMVPTICDLVSSLSYSGTTLEPAGEALTLKHQFKNLAPIHWISCSGKTNKAERSGQHGLRNLAEVKAIVNCLKRIASELDISVPAEPIEIGIISMYRAQVLALEEALPNDLLNHPLIKLELGTVDSFQGREKDVVIASFVETSSKPMRLFYDRRRLNVAISRAKALLIVVGSLDILSRKQLKNGAANPVAEIFALLNKFQEDGRSSREVYDAN